MSVIQTRINCNSEDFKKNYSFHQNLSIELKDLINNIKKMGSFKNLEKHANRGKLTARDRISRLKDKDTEFL